jgi:hypothetical protein
MILSFFKLLLFGFTEVVTLVLSGAEVVVFFILRLLFFSRLLVSEFRFDLVGVNQPFDPSTEFILSKVEGLRTGISTSFKRVSVLDEKIVKVPKQQKPTRS